MPEPTMQLMHEILVRMQRDQTEMRTEMREGFAKVHNRLSEIEGSLALVLHHTADEVSYKSEIRQELENLKRRINTIEEKLAS